MVLLAAAHCSVSAQLAPSRNRAGCSMSFLLSTPFSTAAGVLDSFLALCVSFVLTPSRSVVFFSLAYALFSWNIAERGIFLRSVSGMSLSCGNSLHSSNRPPHPRTRPRPGPPGRYLFLLLRQSCWHGAPSRSLSACWLQLLISLGLYWTSL